MAYTTINKSTDYFNTKLYTGNGGTNAITGVGFQPDWTWVKSRSNTDDHNLFDAVRGVTKCIETNTTVAEFTQSNGLTAFGSDGFTVGDFNAGNRSGGTIASWNWKANGAGSANTDGSISSTVSANTTSGFSIVKYTGTSANTTVGHGLGAVPKIVIVRRIYPGGEWYVHAGALNDNEKVLVLNTTAAGANAATVFNNTAPTSSVFSLGTNGDANGNTYEHIAYCFAEKTGYSKFGSYIGNGNTDGTFVYTGFKPAFVMIKLSSASNENWAMYDNKRNTFNSATSQRIRANTNAVEGASNSEVDLLSNGFKVHDNDAEINSSGATYIYMCFAEAPLVGTNGVTAKAR